MLNFIMYFTRALILKKHDIGEADALCTAYTEHFGLLRIRAQGVKKSEAKLRGHVEPLSVSTIGFVLGKYGERMTHAECVNSLPRIRSSLKKLRIAYEMIELVDRHCFPGERDFALWGHLVDSMNRLENDASVSREALFLFQKGLVRCLGYGDAVDMEALYGAIEETAIKKI